MSPTRGGRLLVTEDDGLALSLGLFCALFVTPEDTKTRGSQYLAQLDSNTTSLAPV